MECLFRVTTMDMFFAAAAFNGDISKCVFCHQYELHVRWSNLQWRYFQGRLFRHQDGAMFDERQRSMAIFPNGMSLLSPTCLMFSGAFQWRYFRWDVSSVTSMSYMFSGNGVQWRYFRMGRFFRHQQWTNVRWSDNVQWRYFQMGCLFRHQHGLYVL
jgi:hypothetical protein